MATNNLPNSPDSANISETCTVVNGIDFTIRRRDEPSFVQFDILPSGKTFAPVTATFHRADRTWTFRPNWTAPFGFDIVEAVVIASAWQVAIRLDNPAPAAPDGDVTAAQSLLASISEPLKLPDTAQTSPELDQFYAGLRAAQGTAVDPRKMGVSQAVIDQAKAAVPTRPKLTAAQRRILKRIDKREQKGIPLQLSEATLADKRQLVRLGQMGLLKTLYPETDRTGLVLTAAGRAALDGAK